MVYSDCRRFRNPAPQQSDLVGPWGLYPSRGMGALLPLPAASADNLAPSALLLSLLLHPLWVLLVLLLLLLFLGLLLPLHLRLLLLLLLRLLLLHRLGLLLLLLLTLFPLPLLWLLLLLVFLLLLLLLLLLALLDQQGAWRRCVWDDGVG